MFNAWQIAGTRKMFVAVMMMMMMKRISKVSHEIR